MFSVDNFYTFMNSRYGLEASARNVIWIFLNHGSKDWNDIVPGWLEPKEYDNAPHLYDSKGVIVLHDQEPFDPELLGTYRVSRAIQNNAKWRLKQTNAEALLMNKWQTLSWPIFCHSEWNSDDIKFVEESGGIPCYYFYHGLISRDWFRHWKHHGRISVSKQWKYKFLLYARDHSGSRRYRKRLVEDLTPIRDQVNYNWYSSQQVSSCSSASISVEDSNNSAIHLVAETVFDQNKIHLTEKSFKPMVMMQPFILFSGAGSLKYLRDYGFKTFGDIWDESYDLEICHEKRYQKILRLINGLSSLTDTEINLLLEKAQPILEHNRRYFFSDEFEDIMLNELTTNMDRSLSIQEQKTQDYPGGSCLYVFDQMRKRGDEITHEKSKFIFDLLRYVQTQDPEYFNRIQSFHPWLRSYLV